MLNDFFNGGAAAAGGYEIERSLRFNSSDSAYCSYVAVTPTDATKFTLSFWVKRSKLGVQQTIMYAGLDSSNKNDRITFLSGDTIELRQRRSNVDYTSVTNAVFRDVSAWYHIVYSWNAGARTLYVNGVSQSFASSSTTTSTHYWQTTGRTLYIGRDNNEGGSPYAYGDFMLADVHFIDGQALDPTSFGEFDDDGIWQPIEYSGTYGTNGFHLPFSDNSSAAALGDDTSGNNNDFTVNNITADFSPSAWDYSQNWATYLTFATDGGGFLSGRSPGEVCFDGTRIENAATVTTGTSAYIEVSGLSLTALDTLEITLLTGSPGSLTWQVTGTNLTTTNISTDAQQFVEIPITGNATTFRVSSTSSARAHLTAIRINGKELILPSYLSAIDSLVDVPQNGTETDTGVGGEVRGNYCTFNPLTLYAGLDYSISDGGLNVVKSGGNVHGLNATFGFTDSNSGKYYFEAYHETGATIGQGIGWGNDVYFTYTYGTGFTKKIYYLNTSCTFSNFGVGNTTIGTGLTSNFGAILGVALDIDNNELKFYVNNVLQATATGVWGTYFSSGEKIFPCLYGNGTNNNGTVIFNFGQRPFAYSAPSGFKALNTANLPTPTIADGSDYMDVALYTGTGVARSITGYEFSPDFVWLKRRSATSNHLLFDIIRGPEKVIESDTTDAEATVSGSLTAFNSDGFSLGTSSGGNNSGATWVAWTWDAGSSTVSNTDGSITSSVRANPSAGFSIATYTGNDLTNQSIGHGLNVAPKLYIQKRRDSTSNWGVTTNAAGSLQFFTLNTKDSAVTASPPDPTSTVVYVSGSGTGFNINNASYITYCFAPVESYSAIGSYTGNGSTDGSFVYTGFKPAFLLVKPNKANTSWWILDYLRSDYNPADESVYPNENLAENANNPDRRVDFLSNGFKLRSTSEHSNENGTSYIYYAVAENPFALNARAR